MGLPPWLLRKLYRKGSLIDHRDGTFSVWLQNPLGTATLIQPPRFVVNGVMHPPNTVMAKDVFLPDISKENPFTFAKGDTYQLTFRGHLLRGGNRFHAVFQTAEFGELELFVEDRATVEGDSEE